MPVTIAVTIPVTRPVTIPATGRTSFRKGAWGLIAVLSAAMPLIQACSLFESEDSGGVSAAEAAALDKAADTVEQRRALPPNNPQRKD